MDGPKSTWLDRAIAWFAPGWGESRARSRLMARHFEAAAFGRRTDGFSRRLTDANAAASGATLGYLRAQARDLVRNNAWARRGLRRIMTNTVGWGIRPQANEASGKRGKHVMERWVDWAESTQCDAAGQLTFYGLQAQVMRTIVESGEVLVRRRIRRPEDGLSVPLQLQVIEPDLIDTGKDGLELPNGGRITQGVEFDPIGRRVAYWLFDQHPGGLRLVNPASKRVPTDSILHVYEVERPGQVRGPSWFASVDVRLHDFDEFEDATLMKQKIAACMAAFVTDVDGAGNAIGGSGEDSASGQPTDSLEPGMILNLPAGRSVTVANPPVANDHTSFSQAMLRAVAAGLGVTYEDLTGDYSQVNFSSARMARIAHTRDVYHWQWNMLIPMFCAPVWMWMLDAMALAGEQVEGVRATWTPPAMPMIDPAQEGKALKDNVRAGVMTHDQMVREQGYDPALWWAEYSAGVKRLAELGIVLDSDASKTTAAGMLQVAPTAAAPPPPASGDPSGSNPT